ncbi:hypothetical protein [Oscillibacter sp.]|nr:hypothetical protein [Oscillibacter sp.]
MDELDARLRAMAKREDWALPAAYESAMDGLEEQIRQGGTLDRPGKRRLGKRVLFLAAALAVLACGFAVAAERMGWLSPVVDDGGSGGMLKTCSVQVDQTVEGNHCDLTLENAITDGRVIYCLVTARYDESFPDIDDVMEDTLLFAGSWADVISCWRVDQGKELNTARFILATGQVSENAQENCEENYLGREVELVVKMLNDRDTGVMHPIEIYAFHVRMNDTIPVREVSWPDGTRAVVTPLRAEVWFPVEETSYDLWLEESQSAVTWEEDFLAKQVLTLYFTDGRALEMEDALTQRIQRGTHAIHIEFVEASEQRAPLCHLSLLSPRLLDPDSVTGLELNGQWYEFPAA